MARRLYHVSFSTWVANPRLVSDICCPDTRAPDTLFHHHPEKIAIACGGLAEPVQPEFLIQLLFKVVELFVHGLGNVCVGKSDGQRHVLYEGTVSITEDTASVMWHGEALKAENEKTSVQPLTQSFKRPHVGLHSHTVELPLSDKGQPSLDDTWMAIIHCQQSSARDSLKVFLGLLEDER